MTTDVKEFITDLDGGVFAAKVAKALSNVAGACIDNNAIGKVTLTFTMKQVANGAQVAIQHQLSYVEPTSKGKVMEDDTTITTMYVGRNGALSIFPEDQGQLFGKKGEIPENIKS